MKRRELAAWTLTAVAAGFGAATLLAGHASASSPPPVFICQARPCPNGIDFLIQDAGTATRGPSPITWTADAGGVGIAGDKLSVYSPTAVLGKTQPSLVLSWGSPWEYWRAQQPPQPVPLCLFPSKWVGGDGTWVCTSLGHWRKLAGG